VAIGFAVTVVPVTALSPAAGAQLYVLAPLAVKVVPGPPEHKLADVGFTLTVGVGFTVMVITAILLQLPVVPVTV